MKINSRPQVGTGLIKSAFSLYNYHDYYLKDNIQVWSSLPRLLHILKYLIWKEKWKHVYIFSLITTAMSETEKILFVHSCHRITFIDRCEVTDVIFLILCILKMIFFFKCKAPSVPSEANLPKSKLEALYY